MSHRTCETFYLKPHLRTCPLPIFFQKCCRRYLHYNFSSAVKSGVSSADLAKDPVKVINVSMMYYLLYAKVAGKQEIRNTPDHQQFGNFVKKMLGKRKEYRLLNYMPATSEQNFKALSVFFIFFGWAEQQIFISV